MFQEIVALEEDGATKIFLYTKGTEGNPSQELKDMLQYMEKTINENVTNQNLDTIHHIVENAKRRKGVGINFMKSWEREEMIKRYGIELGKKDSQEQSAKIIIETCRECNVSPEETMAKLVRGFSLEPEKAQEYMEKYWKS